MTDKRLLIISDDFGMSHSINRGILRAADGGLVRATNFMVPCPWFEEAYAGAAASGLACGIHLTITGEWRNLRWRPLTGGKTITDGDGYLHPQFEDLLPAADPREIYDEYKAQIALLKRREWNITHIDTHMLMPEIFLGTRLQRSLVSIVERVAREENLPYLYSCSGDRLTWFDSMFMISRNGRKSFYDYLRDLKPGFHFAVGHCAVPSDEQASLPPEDAPDYHWALEYRSADLDILTSNETRKILEEQSIELITVDELMKLRG